MKKRCSGILMPVSSLPGGYGIGSMGQAARDFVDFLVLAGQSVWQILPVGPTSYGDSPYQSCSAFAGNPYFIDLDQLAADGLLKPEDYAKENWGTNPNYCDYALLYQKRYNVLRKAYAAFLQQRPVPGYDTPYSDDWYRFTFLSDAWLPDYCLYMAIKEENKMCDWQTWPAPLRLRDPKALEEFRTGHADELGFWAFVQYEFAKQWQALKAYANSKGIKIMGDIPIYVAADSADAWAGRELFEMDSEGHPRRVAGCPPDYFAEDGQLWGNPLYDWAYHKRTNYAWWVRRVRHALGRFAFDRAAHAEAARKPGSADSFPAVAAESEGFFCRTKGLSSASAPLTARAPARRALPVARRFLPSARGCCCRLRSMPRIGPPCPRCCWAGG